MAEANTLPADTYDILIFKLDSDGNLVWRNEIDKSNGEEVSYDLHLMPTSVLLSGGYKNYFIDNAYVNKDILVTGLLASGQTSVYPFDGSMVTTWEIPAESLSLKLPLSPSGTYNFTVDWGDGTQSTITSWDDSEARHVYASAGTYTVQISGTLTHWTGSNYEMDYVENVDGFGFDQISDADKLIRVDSLGDLGFESLYEAFAGATNLTYFSGGVTSNVTDMGGMFSSTRNLTYIDLTTFDTSNVTNMSGMFSYASKVKNLNLSSFNTTNVTDMSSMFHGMHDLQAVDVSNFDTSNVTNMMRMFACNGWRTFSTDMETKTFNFHSTNGLGGLTNLDISNFNTSKVTSMKEMFAECSSLTQLTWGPQFITSEVTDMYGMFEYTPSLRTPLDLSNFDTSKVTDMERMFWYHFGDDIDVSSFNTTNVTNMMGMFSNISVPSLDLSNFNTTNVTDMMWMFRQARINSIDISSFDTSNVTNMTGMFQMNGMYQDFSTNGVLDLSHFDTSKVTTMRSMFAHVSNSINLSTFDTSNVTDMSDMFISYGDTGIDLDLSHFNTSKVQNFSSMFDYFKGSSLNLSNWDLSGNTITYTPNQWGHPFETRGR